MTEQSKQERKKLAEVLLRKTKIIMSLQKKVYDVLQLLEHNERPSQHDVGNIVTLIEAIKSFNNRFLIPHPNTNTDNLRLQNAILDALSLRISDSLREDDLHHLAIVIKGLIQQLIRATT